MLEYQDLLLFILLALVAEVLGTVGGFGSSMFFVPVAGFFLDFQSVLGVTALFHLTSNISKIALFRKGFDKRLVLRIGIPAVLFVILGSLLSAEVNTKWLEGGLAVVLLLIASVFLLMPGLKLKPTLSHSIGGGVVSGFVAGLVGTGGAIRGMTLAAFALPTEVFIATSAIIDLGIDASRSAVYAWNGYVHRDDLYLIPILLVVSIIGTLLGKAILKKVTDTQFRSLVLVLILITGIVTLARLIFLPTAA
jgi:uncharacterized membrane protein YfcA